MILHKYIKFDYGFDSIEDCTLKVSKISELNDPFEFLPTYINNWTDRKIKKLMKSKDFINCYTDVKKKQGFNKKEAKKILRNNEQEFNFVKNNLLNGDYLKIVNELKIIADEHMRLICFSTDSGINDSDQILMWSHYCNNHNGLRIHFDSDLFGIEKNSIKQVMYKSNRVEIDVSLNPYNVTFQNSINEAKITKSISWKYENEYRAMLKVQECTPPNSKGIQFYKFPIGSLKRIDIGLNVTDENTKGMMLLIKNLYHNKIPIYKALLHRKEFKINYSRLN